MNSIVVAKSAHGQFDEAFDELFPQAFRLAYRLIGHVQTAEDVAAEALARAFYRWTTVSRLQYRDAWVMRVTANLAIDVLRRRRRTAALPTEHAATPSEEIVDLRLALGAALQSLPRRQRQAIALQYLADLSPADVATVLHISPGSVKTHVHRGLTSLRARLGQSLTEVIPNVDSRSI
jgi:RNA polymerase sigma-70 factor (ECF subfamily)